jgi:hypothetical protein
MRFFSAWGKIRYFEDVTDANILALDEHLAKKGLKPYSKWNNYHRFLNSFILDAIEEGFLKRNPYKWIRIERLLLRRLVLTNLYRATGQGILAQHYYSMKAAWI